MTMQMSIRESALQYHPFGGRVSVYLFGRPMDWNIAGDEAEQVQARIAAFIADSLPVRDVYAPRPSTFNAKICTFADLTETIDIGHSVTIHRGCDADGVGIPEGESFWLSSADCITIVACNPKTGMTVAAHGGRDCLVDRGRVNGGPAREYESVVHTIADQFSRRDLRDVRVFMTCGIGPEHFDHPCSHEQYGPANTRMAFDILAKWGETCVQGDHFQGKLCLSEIIRSQFISLGVKPHHIGYDTVDTYDDTDQHGELRWWSHRRGDGKKRNGVLIVRNW